MHLRDILSKTTEGLDDDSVRILEVTHCGSLNTLCALEYSLGGRCKEQKDELLHRHYIELSQVNKPYI